MASPPTPPQPRWVSIVPLASGGLVAVLGVLTMADDWLRLDGDAPSLPADVALGLAGAGASMALYRFRASVSRLLAALPLVVGLAELLEPVLDARPLRDLLSNARPTEEHPHVAISLVLVGFALALLLSGTSWRLVNIAGAVAAVGFGALSLTVELGLFFGSHDLGVSSGPAHASALTALVLAALLVGLLACRSDRPPLSLFFDDGAAGTFGRRLLPAVVLLPPSLALLHRTAEERRVVDAGLGLALLAAGMIVVLAVIVSMTARVVRRAEAELLQVNRELEAVFTSMPAIVTLTDLEGTYVRSSELADRLVFPDGGTLVGAYTRDFYPPESRELLIEQEDLVLRQGHIPKVELGTDFNGVHQEWDLTRFPVTDEHGRTIGIGSVALDVTARKSAERAVAAYFERLRNYLDATPDATVMVDRTGTIRYANRRVTDLLGFQPAELVGLDVDRLVPDMHRAQHAALREAYMVKPESREMGSGKELLALRRDGSTIAVEISLGPVETEDGTWIAAALRDVTARRAADLALRDAEQHARYLADHDPLTGAANRRWFQAELDKHLHGAHSHAGGLLIVDVDHFKEVNDAVGHSAGDSLLIDIVEVIGTCLPAGASLSRLGGDEFAVILTAGTPEEVQSVAETLVEAVRRVGRSTDAPVLPTASIGVAPLGLIDHDGLEATDVLVAADDALYAAKAGGRDQVVVWSPGVRRVRSPNEEPRDGRAGRR